MRIDPDFKKFIWNKFSQLDATDLACLRYMPRVESSYYSDEFYTVDCGCWEYFDILREKLNAEWWNNGATKLVFAFKEYPEYVVKIPFEGVANYDRDDCIIECCEPIETNYCELEAEVFRAAFLEDLDYFFCETDYMFSIGGTEFYCAIRCETGYMDVPKSYSDNSYEKAKEKYYSDKEQPISLNCLATLYEQYTIKAVDRLICFLKCNNVNDLHCGNLGFLNGMVCIIDYSGYHEC